MHEENGDVYEGQWNDGVKHGQGKQTYQKGNIVYYSGGWSNGKKNGEGQIKYRDERPVLRVRF